MSETQEDLKRLIADFKDTLKRVDALEKTLEELVGVKGNPGSIVNMINRSAESLRKSIKETKDATSSVESRTMDLLRLVPVVMGDRDQDETGLLRVSEELADDMNRVKTDLYGREGDPNDDGAIKDVSGLKELLTRGRGAYWLLGVCSFVILGVSSWFVQGVQQQADNATEERQALEKDSVELSTKLEENLEWIKRELDSSGGKDGN